MEIEKIELKETLEYYQETVRDLENIALRWANGRMGQRHYAGVAIKKVDFQNETIEFFTWPCTSGLGETLTMPLTYIFDDTGLEEQALVAYKKEIEERTEKAKRIAQLESAIQQYQTELFKEKGNVYGVYPQFYIGDNPYYNIAQTTSKIEIK